MCFAWSVLYDLSLCFLVYRNHPCCTHPLGETHMSQNLLEYSMWFTYIFWPRYFCSNASLISFRARWWFYFIEIIDLSCFTYIILRVFWNNMVICFGYKIGPNMIGIQYWYNKNFHKKVHWILWEVWYLMIVLRYEDGDIRVMLVE